MTEIGAFLKTFIYLISASLLYPTLFLLVALTFFVIACLGGFFAEWLERARLKPCAPHLLPDALKNGQLEGIVPARVVQFVEMLRNLAGTNQCSDAAVENLLQDRVPAAVEIHGSVAHPGPGGSVPGADRHPHSHGHGPGRTGPRGHDPALRRPGHRFLPPPWQALPWVPQPFSSTPSADAGSRRTSRTWSWPRK